MTPQDHRPRHIDRGAQPAELLSAVSAPLSWSLVEYIVEVEHPLGQGMSLRRPVVVSHRQAREASLIAPTEAGSPLNLDDKGVEVGKGRGSVRIGWTTPFSMVLSAWLVSDDEAELYVRLYPRGASAAQSVGFAVLWPQSLVCAEVPLKEERLPYLDAADFVGLWPLLLSYAGLHGFEDRPWVGGFP